ncbi:hypothetical protein AX17_004357 [Amanita inopinata Kibby_2008]|nr:hypothetical protein AX17_004357 [Amanita inopinata Kibby_2008]
MSRLFSLLLPQRPFSTSRPNFAGHNKWSKIKQKKGVMDAQKGAIFGRIRRDIILAIRNSGSADPAINLQLAAVLKRAKEQDVPKDNIEKALAKATAGRDKTGECLVYEALAHNSVGLIIECLTDNTNRTLHNIREILTMHNARFAPVKFMFQRKGHVKVAFEGGPGVAERVEQLIDTVIENGAEDFEQVISEDNFDAQEVKFTCLPNNLTKVTTAATTLPFRCELLESELIYSPMESGHAPGDVEGKIPDLVEELEANEDTLRVWTSLD